jgi:hypothetical protein
MSGLRKMKPILDTWLLGNDFMCSITPVIGLGSTMSHFGGSDMTLMQELSNKRLVRSRAD